MLLSACKLCRKLQAFPHLARRLRQVEHIRLISPQSLCPACGQNWLGRQYLTVQLRRVDCCLFQHAHDVRRGSSSLGRDNITIAPRSHSTLVSFDPRFPAYTGRSHPGAINNYRPSIYQSTMDSRFEYPNANQPARSKVKPRPHTSATETTSTMTASKTKSKPTHWRFWPFAKPSKQGTTISKINGLCLALALAGLSIFSIWKESNVCVSSGIWTCAAAVLYLFKHIDMARLVIATLVSIMLVDRVPCYHDGLDSEDVMLMLLYAQCAFTVVWLIVAVAFRFL